jgi:outer membrane lipoprotein SlyB
MKFNIFTVAIVLALTLISTSCARDLSSNVYTSDSTLSLTLEGEVVSVRKIIIKDTESLQENTLGGLAGGTVGGIAASTAGSGTGQSLAVAGGVIAGAAIGALAQDALSKGEGYEYIVKVDTKNLKSDYYEGSGAMRRAISSAVTNGLVTIIQGQDTLLDKGQEVYVIFSDKRARIIAK